MIYLTRDSESGFTLAEFLTSAFILLVISASAFQELSDTQSSAAYQSEVQAVLDNTRIAMQLIERHIRQAGNDPFGTGMSGITIISDTQLRIRSDITGSAGTSNPDKGDPDGDIADAYEDVTIRYNESTRTLELIPGSSSAQTVAYISGLSLQYFDENGNATAVDSEVRKIRVSISGSSQKPNPQTHEQFGWQITSEIEIAT